MSLNFDDGQQRLKVTLYCVTDGRFLTVFYAQGRKTSEPNKLVDE